MTDLLSAEQVVEAVALEPPIPSSWRWRRASAIAGSVATGIVSQLALMVSGVLIARLLGVESRGQLALLALLPSVLSSVGSLGLPLALTHSIAGQPQTSRELARSARPFAVAQLLVLPLVHAALLWALFAHSASRDIPAAAAITLLVVPGVMAQQYGLAILQGQHRYRPFNILRLAPASLYALGAVVAFAAGWRDLFTITGIWVLSTAVSGVLTIAYGTRKLAKSGAPATESATDMLHFGLKGLLGYVSPVESFRLDQAVAGFLLSPAALGLYVVGAAFTNLPRFVAQSVGMVAYPVVASQPQRRAAAREALHFLIIGSLLAGGVVLILEILSSWLVPFFYGSEFEAAVSITRILLVGALFLSIRRLVSDGLRGMGRPGISSLAELVGWLFLAPCFYILVPRFGLEGVAWSVTISWGSSLAVVCIPVLGMLRLATGAEDDSES